ncbi:MAG: NAD-dependent epimerase/dehydratase family protein [Pseudomonadota bacterium]
MKHILITGGAGFIGRHVAHELDANGYQVSILDSFIDQVHGGEETAMPTGFRVVRGDIRDANCVAAALEGVDSVIHLAAEVGVGQSMYEIARYVGTNDLGTAVLLEAMIKRPVDRIVVASSMSIYGEGRYGDLDGKPACNVRRDGAQLRAGNWEPVSPTGETLIPLPTDEEKPPDLASIYALSKYMQERAVLLFGGAYDVDAVALRLFNVFGAGQALSNPYTGVLANFAARLANGERPVIFEDGKQLRDFVHVRDVARAFRLALENPQAAGQAINIGSGGAYTIKGVATMLAEAMGRPDIEPDVLNRARAGDIRNCFADIGKARDLLGYSPDHDLKSSLPDFVDWVAGSTAVDRAVRMQSELESLGLVS